MIRLVADSGGIIHGGLAQVGRVGVTWAIRSCTSCRARISSVPRSKMSWIDESWATDFERSSSSPGSPLSCCSIGTVISSSTSVEELPRAIVWISTRGGANSGKTSTFALGDLGDAERHHRRRGEEHQPPEPQASGDDPAHQRPRAVLGTSSSVPYTSVAPTVTISVPTGGPPDEDHAIALDAATRTSARRSSSGLGLV